MTHAYKRNLNMTNCIHFTHQAPLSRASQTFKLKPAKLSKPVMSETDFQVIACVPSPPCSTVSQFQKVRAPPHQRRVVFGREWRPPVFSTAARAITRSYNSHTVLGAVQNSAAAISDCYRRSYGTPTEAHPGTSNTERTEIISSSLGL